MMVLADSFRITADRYGYTLARLKQVKKRETDEIVDEWGDHTYHATLEQAQRRIIEWQMRQSVEAASDLQNVIDIFNFRLKMLRVEQVESLGGAA